MKSGEPFNPWLKACGFYPPDIVTALPALMVIGTRRKLGDGHKVLYTRLVRRWGTAGPCYPDQAWLAKQLGVSIRTIIMRLEDLESFGLISRRRRGRAAGGDGQPNEYSFLWHSIFDVQSRPVLKCKNQDYEVQKPTFRSAENDVLMCKNQQPHYKEETCPETCPQLAEQPAESFPRSENRENKNNPSVSVEVIDFIRQQTRFLIGGKMADEGTVQRLAGYLQDRDGCEVFQARVREWSRKNRADSWGILVELAKDVASERLQLAERYPLVGRLVTAVTSSIPEGPSDAAWNHPPEVVEANTRHEEFIQRATANGWDRIDPHSSCESCQGFGRHDTGEVCECAAGQWLARRLEWCDACQSTGMVADPFDAGLATWFQCIHAVRRREREPNAVEETNDVLKKAGVGSSRRNRSEQLGAHIGAIARTKGMPTQRAPAVDPRVRTAVQAATGWRAR